MSAQTVPVRAARSAGGDRERLVLLIALHQLTYHGFIYRYLLSEGGWIEPRLRVVLSNLTVGVSLPFL